MDLNKAREIVAELVNQHLFYIGKLAAKPAKIEHSLADLVKAHQIVEAENSRMVEDGGVKVFTTTLDERLIAAIFVANNYEGYDPSIEEVKPVALSNGNFVVVIKEQLAAAPQESQIEEAKVISFSPNKEEE